jgi:steroid delta-isomerase-like uncharacterized protein
MSTDQNKTVVRRFFEEVINEGRYAVADELFAPTFGEHGSMFGEPGPRSESGPARAIEAARRFRSSFPDIHFTVEELVAEGDKVVVRVTFRGTHQGEYMGIPATGKAVQVSGVELARLASGRIVEEGWHYMDEVGLLKQLGVLHHG